MCCTRQRNSGVQGKLEQFSSLSQNPLVVQSLPYVYVFFLNRNLSSYLFLLCHFLQVVNFPVWVSIHWYEVF